MEGAMRLGVFRSFLGQLTVGALLAAFAALGPGGSAVAARAHSAVTHAAPQVSLSTEFHRVLDPSGRWTTHQRWGEVWIPARLPDNWRPYKRGKWVYTDEWGWYWAADEDWGWITYHYGRWVYDPELGWIWIPGDEWGPAWVKWRWGTARIGWCPLPPDEIIDEVDTSPDVWIFVETQDFLVPEIDTVVLSFAETTVFIRETVIVNETVVVRSDNVLVAANPGVNPSFIAAAVKHPVQTFAVRPRVLPGTPGVTNAIVTAGGRRVAERESIKPQARRIQPAASVPRPIRLQRDHVAAAGPNAPNIMKKPGAQVFAPARALKSKPGVAGPAGPAVGPGKTAIPTISSKRPATSRAAQVPPRTVARGRQAMPKAPRPRSRPTIGQLRRARFGHLPTRSCAMSARPQSRARSARPQSRAMSTRLQSRAMSTRLQWRGMSPRMACPGGFRRTSCTAPPPR